MIQGVTCRKKEGPGDIFGGRSYKIKVDARQSSISMLNEVKEIEKIFWRSRTIMASSSDPLEKADSLNSYYASIFRCERNNPQIQSTESGKPFTISINSIRKRLSTIVRVKFVGPDVIPGEILKLGGEATIPKLAKLLDVTTNDNAIQGDWKKALVVPMYRGGGPKSKGTWKIQTTQPNLGCLQATEARYRRVTKTSVGKVWMVIRGST